LHHGLDVKEARTLTLKISPANIASRDTACVCPEDRRLADRIPHAHRSGVERIRVGNVKSPTVACISLMPVRNRRRFVTPTVLTLLVWPRRSELSEIHTIIQWLKRSTERSKLNPSHSMDQSEQPPTRTRNRGMVSAGTTTDDFTPRPETYKPAVRQSRDTSNSENPSLTGKWSTSVCQLTD